MQDSPDDDIDEEANVRHVVPTEMEVSLVRVRVLEDSNVKYLSLSVYLGLS